MRHLCDLPVDELRRLFEAALRGIEPRERDPLFSRRRSLAVDAIVAADELLDDAVHKGAA